MSEIIEKTLNDLNITGIDKNMILASELIGVSNDSIIKMMVNASSDNATREAEKQKKKYYLKNATTTEKKIHAMLTESTGCNIMDSGGDNSRHWQINRKIKDMRKNKELTWSIIEDSDYIDASVDLFHWLNNNIEYTNDAKKLTKQFYSFCRKKTDSYYSLMDDWINEQVELGNIEANQKQCYNTYNDSSLLSQDIQYFIFEQNGKSFVLMQIHNGADIRGGYTNPVIFETFDYFMPYPRILLKCDCIEHDSEYDLPKEWKTKLKDSLDKYDCILFCPECEQEVEGFVN